MIHKIYNKSLWLLWIGLILLMPITSMPLVAKLVSAGTTVASPAGLVVLVLMLIWFIPAVFKGRTFTGQMVPLLVFAIFSITITLISLFVIKPPYKLEDPLKNSLEAFITLGIGLSFYFLVCWWLTDRENFEHTIRLINWSGVLILIWVVVQAVSWFLFHRYPEWVKVINDFISVGPLYRQRVSGFTLEPSWFAHQLNMLYLPLWLAFTIQRTSAHRFRLFHLSLENILLVGGVAALFLSYSRIGLAAFMMMVGYILIRINLVVISRVQNGILTPRVKFIQRIHPILVSITLGLVMVLGYLVAILGLGLVLSRLDPRMAKLFVFDINHTNPLMQYANNLTFASLVYWQAGWKVFNDFPILGVGLGQVGFYMTQSLSDFAWRLFEVRNLLFRSGNALNIKSLWVRLLAETGIVGFSIFFAWLLSLWQTAKIIEKSADPFIRGLSWLGQFVIIGLILEGFSVDTFALPYFWFSFGLLTAAYVLVKNPQTKTKMG